MRILATMSVVLVLSSSGVSPASAQDEKPFTTAEWRTIATGLQVAAFGPDAARQKLRAQWGAKGWLARPLTKVQAEQVAKVLALGNPTLTEKGGGQVVLPIPTGDGAEQAQVLFKPLDERGDTFAVPTARVSLG